MMKWPVLVLVSTTIYSLIRYAVFAQVAPVHIPVYLLNKSISMASAIFLLTAAWNRAEGAADKMRFWGAASFHTALVHVLLSLCILNSAYFPKFFNADKMNLTGELSILFGVLTAYCYACLRMGSLNRKGPGNLQLFSSLCLTGHLAIMGFSGWLTVASWPGFLPPISLISFICAFLSLLLFWSSKNRAACPY